MSFLQKFKLSRLQQHAIRSSILTIFLAGFLFYHPLEGENSGLFKLSNSINSIKQTYFSPQNPNKELVLVSIDDKSLNNFGRWPWPRTLQGKLYKTIHESKVLAVDILYLDNDDSDSAFSDQLSTLPQLITALAALPDSKNASFSMREKISPYMINTFVHKKNSSLKEQYVLMPEISQLSAIPDKLLPSISRSGLVHINHTQDNQQLHYMPGMIDGAHGVVIPSLGLQVLQSLYDKNFSIETGETNRIFFQDEDSPYFILTNYSGIPLNFYKNSVDIISASDLLNGVIHPSVLKNKIVFVGFTATGLHDTYLTPLGPIKGVELHTTLVSNFLNNEIIIKSKSVELCIFLLLVFFSWVIVLLQPLSYLKRFIFVSSVILFIFCIDFLLFRNFNVWINTYYFVILFFILSSVNELIWSIDQEYSSGNLKRAFQSYLSEDLLNMIRQNPEKINLGGQKQEASFLFSDLRDFSRLSEELSPEDLVDTLNRYFSHMTRSILDHKGMLDKYIGDAVMAIFNAPLEVPNHALEACLCALDMSEKLTKFNNEQRRLNKSVIKMGIGINTGEAIIGNMGSDIRFSYTAMGDAVNTASRIETITKTYQCEILIGEHTWVEVKSRLLTRYIDTIILKGKDQPSHVYQVLPNNSENYEMCKVFKEARILYSSGKMPEALSLFKSCEEKWQDKTASVFSERCEYWIKNGVPANWADLHKL